MKYSIFRKLKIVLVLLFALAVLGEQGSTVQLDYKGSESITNQVWNLEFTIPSMGEESFSVRLPFPNYTYVGKWATYTTHDVSVYAVGECGPIDYELYHYNEGYSNQGVWLKVTYPCYENRVYMKVRQSAQLSIPGLDYPLTFHTNNEWMQGSAIVDAYSYIVEDVLSEALAMPGDWHVMGERSVPEKIVNWMNENMSWSGTYTFEIKSASQVLTELEGHCEEWAHAACALLIQANIPAKVVMVGTIPSYNSTPTQFDSSDWHLCVAYWDGFGWILIDPRFSSGFAIANRVILGADRDSWNLKMVTNPAYLRDNISNSIFDYGEGSFSGSLDLMLNRCNQYANKILEQIEYPNPSPPPGCEPIDNIVPNTPTDANYTFPDVSGLGFSNYPNPFNPVTTFKFIVNHPGIVRIDLYTVEGKYAETVYNNFCDAGRKEVYWNCSEMPSGVYFARISTSLGTETRKVILVK